MLKSAFLPALTIMILSSPVFAADPEIGEKDFRKCKACHVVKNEDNVIAKGGKTGPNLYGVVGRQAGSLETYKYSKDLIALGEQGFVWTEETLVAFVQNPKDFVSEKLGRKARPKMSYKQKDASDIIAFLAKVGPALEAPAETQVDSDDAADK